MENSNTPSSGLAFFGKYFWIFLSLVVIIYYFGESIKDMMSRVSKYESGGNAIYFNDEETTKKYFETFIPIIKNLFYTHPNGVDENKFKTLASLLSSQDLDNLYSFAKIYMKNEKDSVDVGVLLGIARVLTKTDTFGYRTGQAIEITEKAYSINKSPLVLNSLLYYLSGGNKNSINRIKEICDDIDDYESKFYIDNCYTNLGYSMTSNNMDIVQAVNHLDKHFDKDNNSSCWSLGSEKRKYVLSKMKQYEKDLDIGKIESIKTRFSKCD